MARKQKNNVNKITRRVLLLIILAILILAMIFVSEFSWFFMPFVIIFLGSFVYDVWQEKHPSQYSNQNVKANKMAHYVFMTLIVVIFLLLVLFCVAMATIGKSFVNM